MIIAEIAQAHDGSLGIAHSYIDALASTGVDAIKFQTHIAESESSEFEEFRVLFSYADKSRFDYWKRMEFTIEQWAGLKKHCEEKGMEFISSPFSITAVILLEKIGVQRYKIGSGEVNNLLMLERIARTGKEIIVSSGMSSFKELDQTIEFLKPFGNKITILQCTTAYPTNPGQWDLKRIPELKERYGLPVGFSDHSGKIYACLAAATLGAEILEFHAVFSKEMFGPDAKASLEMDEIKKLVEGVTQIKLDLNTSINFKEDNHCFKSLKQLFEKSLAVNNDLLLGHKITFSDLESKKPAGKGIPAGRYKSVVGKTLKRDLKRWSFINEEDIF